MTYPEAIISSIETAAVRKYHDRAQQNPVLHEFATEASRDVVYGFQDLLGKDFERYRERIETGYYRIMMDFTSEDVTDDPGIDMLHINDIVAAFLFLADVNGRDWDATTREFALLAPSMEIVREEFDTPNLTRQSTRFGFLFALALDTGTATGLMRPDV